jgi:hypothetical protein
MVVLLVVQQLQLVTLQLFLIQEHLLLLVNLLFPMLVVQVIQQEVALLGFHRVVVVVKVV